MISTVFALALVFLSPAAAYAETGGGEAPPAPGVEIWGVLRALGLFILVMAILYLLLNFTKKIASWIDAHKK